MSRATEQSLKAIHEVISKYPTENMTMEEVNALLQEHLGEINNSIHRIMTEKDAKTADDFLDLAERVQMNGDDAETLRLVRKALKLDPQNLDARLLEIQLGEKDPRRALVSLRKTAEMGRKQLEKAGFFREEYIGDFWGVLETRPYMRVRNEYVSLLKELGMLRQAAREAEDMIRLNTQDNLGLRFTLMHIYAALEEAGLAEELLSKYAENEEGQMLLPLTLLYYKLGEMKKAEDSLMRLMKAIKDTKRFVKDILSGKMEDKIVEIHERGGYSPYSEEELLMAWYENGDVYDSSPFFFQWAADVLKV